MTIMVTKSSMPRLEDYVKEIEPIFESHMLTNMGPVYKKFQHQLKEYLNVPELSLFVNGHMALEMAIQAMGLRCPGGEVITTPFTFISTTHAIVRNGLRPVFCDINPDDYTINTDKIEELITDKTVAIIPVHVYGNICNVEKIKQIAENNNLKVIYDAAHAFGVTYKGIAIGNFGDASMFSFHATKVFNTIEGGAIAFHDKKYKKNLHNLKNFGIEDSETIGSIGGNAKLDEFRAAMGICNLKQIDKCIAKRAIVAQRYDEHFMNMQGIRINAKQKDVNPNYSYYPIYVNAAQFGKSRDDIYRLLKKHDIYSRKYFYPAVNETQCYKDDFKGEPTPIAHDVSLNILTLPLYEELSLDDVDMICNIIEGK